MPKAKTPSPAVTISTKEIDELIVVLRQTVDVVTQAGADGDLIKQLQAVIDKLTTNRDKALARAPSLRDRLSRFQQA